MMMSWSCGCYEWSDHYDFGNEYCSLYPNCPRGKQDIDDRKRWEKERRIRERKEKKDEEIRQQAIKKLTLKEIRVLGLGKKK